MTFRRLLAANLVGLGVVYLFGMLYYYGICQVLGTSLVLASVSVWISGLGIPRDLWCCCVWWGLFWACAQAPGIAKERKA